jgi:hypothetical protein
VIFLKFIALVLGLMVAGASSVWADEEPANRVASPRLTTDQLATWIDEQFAAALFPLPSSMMRHSCGGRF